MSVLHLMSHFGVNVDVAGRDGLSICTLVSAVEALTASLLTLKYCLYTVHRKHKKLDLICCFVVYEHSLSTLW